MEREQVDGAVDERELRGFADDPGAVGGGREDGDELGRNRGLGRVRDERAQGRQPWPEHGRGTTFERASPQRERAPLGRDRGGLLDETGLADAGLALDDDEARRSGRFVERGDQLAELAGAAEQLRSVRGSRGSGHGKGSGRGVEAGIVIEDRRLQISELAAGIDAELVEQGAARLLDGAQCVRLPARAVEGERELGAEGFPQGIEPDELGQLARERAVAAECEIGRDAVFDGSDALFLESSGQPGCKLPVGELDQRGPAPERVGRRQDVAGSLGIAAGEFAPALVDHVLEVAEVDIVARGGQAIARRVPTQQLGRAFGIAIGFERLPQPRDVALQGARGRRRRIFAPQCVEQGVRRDDSPVRDEERREHRARLDATEFDRCSAVVDDLQRAQKTETHCSPDVACALG